MTFNILVYKYIRCLLAYPVIIKTPPSVHVKINKKIELVFRFFFSSIKCNLHFTCTDAHQGEPIN